MEQQIKSELSHNVRLSDVSVSAEGKLVVDRWPETKSYEILVPMKMDSISITATTEDPNATIHINGTPVTSGQPSGLIPLDHGLNRLDVMVTAEDECTQENYEVKVIRSYPTPNWERVLEEAPWVARDSSGELSFDNRMWLFGGYVPEVIGDVWASHDGINWDRMSDIPDDGAINIPASFVYDGKMWIGSTDSRFYCSEDGKTWTLVTAEPPWRGSRGCGAAFGGKMWVICGASGREIWSSSDGVNWKLEQSEAPWSPRNNFGNVFAYAGKLWLIGGSIGSYQPFKAYRDVWCSEDGVNWTEVTDEAPWPARMWTSCVVYRNRIWLLGGFRVQPTWQNFSDVWYTSDGKDWRQLVTEDSWSARHELSAYAHNDRLWVVAGNAWPLMNDVWNLHVPGMMFITQPVVEDYVGLQYRYRAEADFNESLGPISYRLLESPEWLSIDSETGVISGTPTSEGESPVVVEAFDDAGEKAEQEFVIHTVLLL